ncbi:MAG: 1-deoxy-D-xylulose-5-phosphate reductoisomerase [Ruminiclostridium sp.]|jgi:1-deoxy-D-xylulose-5-phosphate reductoisomerase|nr:1-deoxy-D-xylulose-5-phosphate reductoisomerase [Ruminiclostridium sp.]
MERHISILGSTGSIGTQTLEVARHCGLPVAALTARRSIDLLEQQARQFHPQVAAVADQAAAAALARRLSDTPVQVLAGEEGILAAAALPQAGTVVTALVGIAGLGPTLAAIDAGKRIALANKETLVCAGPLVMARAKARGAEILPVDSEHSAIFQSLQGGKRGELRRILLTASGGPFYGYTRAQLDRVTPGDALKHPNWSMGAKVSIDSATLMNKGLELLEAMSLFDVSPEQIEILVHRESIVHSAVEYCDGSVLAQLGEADMRLPIQYALTYPHRVPGPARRLDLFTQNKLTFAPPDLETFPCLALAISAAKEGGTAPAILNGANEAAVAGFLSQRIGFLDIPRVVQAALEQVEREPLSLEAVHRADQRARTAAEMAMETLQAITKG